MNIPDLVARLVGVLEEMATRHREWAALANRHRLDLVARRMDAVQVGAQALDSALESMTPCDDQRIELSRELGLALGLRHGDRVPTVSELRDALGPELSAPLVAAARDLRNALALSSQLADRNRSIAEAGRRSTEASVKALTRIVVRSRSTQAAYDRAGARSSGVAIPVAHRVWKG